MNKSPRPTDDGRGGLNRRTLFAGASTVGVLAAAAAVVSRAPVEAEPVAQPKAPPAKGGGYTLSEHVKRYYQTTRV